MAIVSHATLTGVDLHEPKGVSTAASGTVYIANGAGTGSWGSVSTSLNFVGMIADFTTPVAPSGWLECDGSAVSRTTYADLWAANTIQQSGTRSSGSPVITGLTSTTYMKPGYFVGGSGIGLGTTILTVDSSTQITLSANAVSSGTSTVIVSPWAQGDGSTSFNLPDAYTSGRFRRSRTSSVQMGAYQADQNKTHTHTGTTDSGGSHTHSVTDPGHNHTGSTNAQYLTSGFSFGGGSGGSMAAASVTINNKTTGISIDSGGSHTHTFTSDASGSSETRPVALVVMTCVKY